MGERLKAMNTTLVLVCIGLWVIAGLFLGIRWWLRAFTDERIAVGVWVLVGLIGLQTAMMVWNVWTQYELLNQVQGQYSVPQSESQDQFLIPPEVY